MAAESEFEPHAGDEHILTDSGQASFEMAGEGANGCSQAVFFPRLDNDQNGIK